MAGLEELKRGATVKGILPDGFITVVDVSWIGSVAIELTYKDSNGKLANELIYRDRRLNGGQTATLQAEETKHVETVAMMAVIEAERQLGFEPRDVSAAKNEILTALNKPDQLILAIVQVDLSAAAQAGGEQAVDITYLREPFGREPDLGVTSVNYRLSELLSRGGPPGWIWMIIQ